MHILALSKDELTLAVCAGDQTVYIYDVPSLVHKVRICSPHGMHSQAPLTCILFVGSYLKACRHIHTVFFNLFIFNLFIYMLFLIEDSP